MAKTVCWRCKFFDPQTITCRYDTPAIFHLKGIRFTTEWPVVDPEHDWCGKFKRYKPSKDRRQIRPNPAIQGRRYVG